MVEERVGNIRKHIPQIYEKGKPYIASFAPIVFEAYRQNDKVAEHIIRRNARELANLMNAVARHQGGDVCELVLSGSVFKAFDVIQPILNGLLESEFKFILSDVSPVYGTVMQAAVQVGVQNIESFKRNLDSGMDRGRTPY